MYANFNLDKFHVLQVFSSIPSEEQGESFDLALSRVRRCVVGCPATDDDSDSDIEIVSESVTVNLRCPVSFTLVVKNIHKN